MISLDNATRFALKTCMNLKNDENLLIIYDNSTNEIADSFFKQGKEITKFVKKLKIKELKVSGQEPAEDIAKEMLNHDVIMIATSKSLSHTKARRDACEKGARIASMPGITSDIIRRALAIDYEKMAERGHKIRDLLRKSDNVRIITKLGTDVVMSVKGRDVKGGKGGIIHKKGEWDNLPAGEACTTPVEGSTNGILIVDGSFGCIGKLKNPIKIEIKNGYAVKINGCKEAKKLVKILKDVNNKYAYNIAELGIGTNDKAKITGCVLEDEKVFGTAHMALGNSKSLGGLIDVPIHLDGVFLKPTIFVDNVKIIQNGKLLI